MKLEFLMLAHRFDPKKYYIGGYYLSEKLDGTRAYYDGGISRGLPASEVPFANCIKDGRLIKKVTATGLWSRSGKVIHAPDYWLNQLPKCPLDGELFLDRGCFQELRTIVAEHVPGPNWQDIKLMAFDSPPWEEFARKREIKIRSEYSYWIPDCEKWCKERAKKLEITSVQLSWTFEHIKIYLEGRCKGVAYALQQERLPLRHSDAIKRVNEALDNFVNHGAEGVILRNPASRWECKRSHSLLKVKPFNDAEGRIIGFTSGRETDRGSKLLGKIGALILDYNGKRLELSGLTDQERQFESEAMGVHASNYPGEDMPEWFQGKYFKKGNIVTFKYRELSDDLIPKEARYWRQKNV